MRRMEHDDGYGGLEALHAHLMRDAIRRHQTPSDAIRRTLRRTQTQSDAIRKLIRGLMRGVRAAACTHVRERRVPLHFELHEGHARPRRRRRPLRHNMTNSSNRHQSAMPAAAIREAISSNQLCHQQQSGRPSRGHQPTSNAIRHAVTGREASCASCASEASRA